MKSKRVILRQVFSFGVGLYAVLALAEFVLPGFSTNAVPMTALAVLLIILGVATAIRPPRDSKLQHYSTTALHAVVAAILTFPFVWLTLSPFGMLAPVAALAAAAVVGLSLYLLTSVH